MNRIIKNEVILLIVFLLTYVSCDVENPPPPVNSLITNISFPSGSYTIQVNYGQIANISVTPNNINIATSDITIESSDKDVASAIVTKSTAGVITVSIVTKKVGTATLTLKIKNSALTGSVNIIVTADAPPLSAPVSLGLTGCSVDLFIGQSYSLYTNVSPKNAKDTSVTWSSDNGSFVSASDKGVIKALSSGIENVIATSNADKTLMEKCKVNVLVPATSIELNQTTLTLTYGSTATLTAKVKPDNVSINTVNWDIDNKEIATVKNGIVTPLKTGKANIIVTSTSNSEITATCELTILSKGITSVNITEESYNLRKTESHKLTAEVFPQDADNKTLTWSSGNKEIVSVSENGTITGLKLGEAKVYATSNQNTSAKDSITVYVQGVSISKNTLVMDKGTNYSLTASVFPSTLTGVTWSSSDENIATVNANTGEVSAISRGEVQIYATLPNPESGKPPFVDTCKISVKIYLKSITFEDYRLVLAPNTSISLTPIFTPSDADNQGIKWTSEFPAVATVEDGVVSAHNIGETNIKATSDFDATITATVKVFVKGIILNKYTLNLKKGNNQTLHTTLYPTDLTDKSLTWTSSNDASVTVDNTGKIRAVGTGNATITVTSVSDNTISATCEISVIENPSGIDLNYSNLELLKGETETLTGVVTKQVDNTAVTWRSDNENIATVDATSGVVLAKSGGSVNLIATSVADENIIDTCKLFVNAINLDHNTLEIPKYSTAKITPTVYLFNTQNLAVKYETKNANIASVDANGLISGVSTGETVIKVISVYNSAVFDTCKVTIQGIIFSVTSEEVLKDQSKTLTASLYPASLSGTIIWSVDNTEKAEITADGGVLTGKTYGEAVVKATSSTNSLIYETLKISVVGITLSPATVTLNLNGTVNLTHIGFSAKTKDLAVTYESSDPAVASVSATGTVTGKTIGNAKITIKFTNDQDLSDSSLISVQGIVLSASSVILKKGKTQTVTATVYPLTLMAGVTWTTENDQIATVSTDGLITAIGFGTTKITATSKDNSDIKSSLMVTVLGLSLDKKREFIVKGKKKSLVGTFSPIDFSNPAFTWRSENTNIVTVLNGEVTAVDTGTTNVIITSTYDNSITDTCKVSVPYIRLNSYNLNFTYPNAEKYRSYTLIPLISPSDIPINSITYKSDNTNIVNVDNNGIVNINIIVDFNSGTLLYSFQCGGITKITVTSDYDNNITSTVNVFVLGMTVDKTDVILKNRNSESIIPTYYYKDLTFDKVGSKVATPVSYSSEDITVAEVNSNGLITAKGYGKTKILMKSKLNEEYSNLIANNVYFRKINVYIPKLSIDNDTIVLKNNQTQFNLNASLIPTDISNNPIIEWSSDNTNVASVNANGLVSRVGVGKTNIIAKYKFNNDNDMESDTCVVFIGDIKVNKNIIVITKGNKDNLSVNVNLGNSLSNEVTWSSSNINIATISATGEINAVDHGEVLAIATSNANPIFKDTCIIKVIPKIYFIDFKFEISNNTGMLSDVSLSNFNVYQYGGDFPYIGKVKLIPTFSVPTGTTVKVNGETQTSGVSIQDFTSAVNYVLKSGNDSVTYRVALNFINDSLDVTSDGALNCKFNYKKFINTAILADSMNGYSVIGIGSFAFGYYTFNDVKIPLKSLHLPNNITYIASYAFTNCVNLNQELIIPPKVTRINYAAFALGNKLFGELYIPPSVTLIENQAFQGCTSFSSIKYKLGTIIETSTFLDINPLIITTYN